MPLATTDTLKTIYQRTAAMHQRAAVLWTDLAEYYHKSGHKVAAEAAAFRANENSMLALQAETKAAMEQD